ncbi:N-acetyltransferase [Tomitella fengzijianii]|uniref:N-acetyltransferase n=1 Tax=Tomitella fengzijianii TaxID=2597660 RepID=A0A516X0T9_9ACTN|nr:N-acetyltransferase [Tomitella fengzijianii]QDQ96704.1 N-acetyltransferase [Tomitella fengzijianii]
MGTHSDSTAPDSAEPTVRHVPDKRIVPMCPYVAKYIKSHHGVDEALTAVAPDAIAAAQAAARR